MVDITKTGMKEIGVHDDDERREGSDGPLSGSL